MNNSNSTEKSQAESNLTEELLDLLSLSELPEKMQKAAARAGWKQLTPVQAQGIPYFQARRDLMAQARTGSGKTGAFVLPILEQVDISKRACQALILVPTRELARQVTEEAVMLAGDSGLRVQSVYGGTSYTPQLKAFKEGVHLVVGTPGRILDHLIKRNLSLSKLQILIFDEADRMLSMGFYPDMERIQQFLPDRRVYSYMFSATFPTQVMRLAQYFLKQPAFISLSRDHVHVEDTRHVYCMVPGLDKDRALVRIIEMENPHQAIIFCNTKDRVFYVTTVLQRFGYNADQLSSDLSQSAREQVLKRLREGKLRFLVATDVAARGIDIIDLSHVILYEPPDETESYIHRAGRTGRAGATGMAIMLINYNEKRMLTRIAAHYEINFEEMILPQDEDVQALVTERLTGRLEARLRDRDRLQVERMQRFLPLVEQLGQNEEGQALLAMLLDDTYHDWMHHPVELAPVGTPTRKSTGKSQHRKSKGRRPRGRGSRQGGKSSRNR